MLWKCSTFHLTTMKNLRWIACLIYFSVNSKHDISLPYGVRSEREVFVMKINQAKQNQKCSAQRTRRRKNYKFSILASHGRWLVICAICDITFGWEYGLANVDQQWHRIVQARCATLENTVNNQSREKCGIEAWVHVINQIKTLFRMRAIFLALQFRAGWPTRSILSVFFSLHLKKSSHISRIATLTLFFFFFVCNIANRSNLVFPFWFHYFSNKFFKFNQTITLVGRANSQSWSINTRCLDPEESGAKNINHTKEKAWKRRTQLHTPIAPATWKSHSSFSCRSSWALFFFSLVLCRNIS